MPNGKARKPDEFRRKRRRRVRCNPAGGGESAQRSLRTLKTYLGCVMRGIEGRVLRQPSLNALFKRELYLRAEYGRRNEARRAARSIASRSRDRVHRQGRAHKSTRSA